MPLRSQVGSVGGQKYSVLKSIQTFLNQMAVGALRLHRLS